MQGLRIKSNSEYIIPIERQNPLSGEWEKTGALTFDISDTGLTSKMIKTFERIDELTKKYEAEAAEIDSRTDEAYNEYITKNQVDGAKLIDNFYTEARGVMDGFLGSGSCQMIFGDKNYYDMFSDLTEQLKPHFEKMGLDAKNLKKRAIEKHAPNRAARRVLK